MSVKKGLLDLNGVTARRKVSPKDTIGVGGNVVYGGYVQDNEKDVTLTGSERWRRYSNVLTNCSIVGAGVRFYLNLVAKAGWTFEPADESDKAKELAERVEKILTQELITPWHRVVRRGSMYRFWGFSVQEWVARRLEDGVIGFHDVEPRPQPTIERWDLTSSGFVDGLVQLSPQTSEELYLPRKKLFYMVDDSISDDPRGLGIFRHVVNPAKELARFEQLEGFGFEVDLRGIPVGRAPFTQLREMEAAGDITRDQRLAIEQPLKDFISGHIKSPQLGLLLDSITYQDEDEAAKPSNTPQWDMSLLQGDSQGHEAVAAAIERKNREIARILGVEGLLLGGDGAGSLALSRDKSNNFALLVDSALTELAETVDSDLVTRIFELNGWDMDLKPGVKTDSALFSDVEQVTGALSDMARAGAILPVDDPAINEVRDLLGLSRQPEGMGEADALIPNPVADHDLEDLDEDDDEDEG